jgi:hypothetical protein
MIRTCRRVIAVVALLAATGCASTVRTRAITLSDSGGKVARATEAALAETNDALDQYVESQYLLSALTGQESPEATLRDIAGIQRALHARAEVTRQLAGCYAALNAQASYDASGQVQAGVNGLAGALDEYHTALRVPAPSATVTWLISEIGAGIAGRKQARELKAASRAIRQGLERFHVLLDDERRLHVSVRTVLEEQGGITTTRLWALGFGRADALLRDHVARFGLTFDEKQMENVLKDLRAKPSIGEGKGETRETDLRKAVETVIQHRAKRRAVLQEEILSQTLAAIHELIGAHRKFEMQQDADLATTAEHIAALRAKVEQFKKIGTH